MKQQNLEDRQADVEFELRCLLNKPGLPLFSSKNPEASLLAQKTRNGFDLVFLTESDWSQEDRGREQQLMDELVAIIEQRNQIVDQDQQRWMHENKQLPLSYIKTLKCGS